MNENDSDVVAGQYRQLEKRLAALIGPVRFSKDQNLRLERIEQLLAELGHPHLAYPAIHVGGTAGKGSTATMIAAILTAAGHRTGLHTSPHLQIVNERHQVNGLIAPTSRLLDLYHSMEPAIDAVAVTNPFGRPSYFEAQAALSFTLFAREGVDVAVIEVGLGGPLDATNVVDAEVAVLTNIGLDHTAILGDTIEAIAGDKTGIIKPGQIVVSGFSQPSVQEILIQRCQERGAQLWLLGRDFDFHPTAGGGFDLILPQGNFRDLHPAPHGPHQLINAALACTAALLAPGLPIDEAALRTGLANVKLPGRLEIVQQTPRVVLDGAHSPDKMAAAVKAMTPWLQGNCLTVLALKAGKAAEDILPYLLSVTDRLFVTSFGLKGLWRPVPPRKLSALAAQLAPDLRQEVIADPRVALERALTVAKPGDLVWVTGSFYLIGDVRGRWFPSLAMLQAAEKAWATQPAGIGDNLDV